MKKSATYALAAFACVLLAATSLRAADVTYERLLNPGKVFPTLHRCAELGRMHVRAGQLPFPDIPRF